MTLADNQDLYAGKLSANAARMLELKDLVMCEWDKRLRSAVKEAESLPHPILINTFPILYENLAQSISPAYPRNTGYEGNTVATEHGGERARLTNYNAQAVISEYQLLRWTIFDVLKSNNVELVPQEIFIINTSIDECIRDAVNAFAMAQSLLRERFVAALTHDLRNPLAAASVAAELVMHTGSLEKAKELAGSIIGNLNRMDSMLKDLLDAILFQSGERLRLHFDHFDILEVAREVCRHFNTLHGQRIVLNGNPAKGYWDREAVKRAIENLIGNAVKYSFPDSTITVTVASSHGRMMLTVHNEGDAIPPEQVEAIFQVFRRTAAAKESHQQGWGIGLPYVRTVAESHGGSVGVDSAAERGTAFFIDMPLDSRPYQDSPTLGGR